MSEIVTAGTQQIEAADVPGVSRSRKAVLAAVAGGAATMFLTRTGSAAAADSDVPGAVILAPDTTGRNRVQPTANIVPLSVRGASNQSFSLTEWQNSTGNVLASVRYDGAFVSRSSVRIFGATTGGASVAQPLLIFGSNADGTGDKYKWSMGLDVASTPANNDFFIGRVNEDSSVTDMIYMKQYAAGIATGIGFVPPPDGHALSVASPDIPNSWTALWLRQGSANTGGFLKATTSTPNTLFEVDRFGRVAVGRGAPRATLDVQKDAALSPQIALFRDSARLTRGSSSGPRAASTSTA